MSNLDSGQAFRASEQRLFERYGLSHKSHFLELRDPALRTRVLEVGSGRPVLFVHGGGAVGAQWLPLLPHLSGIRALLVDRPGHGLSGPFDYRGVDLRRHGVAFLDSVMAALGVDALPVVGSSMGGAWAMRLAHDRPERVTTLVQLGCPALLLDSSAPLPMRLLGGRGLGKLLWSLQKPSVKMMKRIHQLMGHRAEALDALPIEFWQTLAEAGRRREFERAFLSLLHGAIGPFGPRAGQPIGEALLRGVPQATLFVWGDNDAFGGPEIGRRATQVMPSARLEVVSGAHQPWFDQPETVGKLIGEFLA